MNGIVITYLILLLVKRGSGKPCSLYACRDGTPPNPSTIDVMVGSPSKNQTHARDMLQSLGNLFLVRLVIY